MALTAKQARFVQEYLIDLNATAAYKRAGYKGSGKSAENAASRLLGNVGVAREIKKAIDKRSNDLGIDARYVLTTIKETIDRCRQVHPVLDRKGEQVYVRVGEDEDAKIVPAFEFDPTGVLKGAELLGRHLAIFNDKLNVNHTFSDLSDADLEEEIATLHKQIVGG